MMQHRSLRIILPLTACGIALSGATAGPLGFLMPDPDLEVVTVTDATPAGALLPAASPKAPVYYLLSVIGTHDFGGIVANVKLPGEKEVVPVAAKVLAEQGYLPAAKGHPPSLLVCLTWGTFNVDTDQGVSEGTTQVNRDEMMRFLGGYKVGISPKNDVESPNDVRGPGAGFKGADAETLASIAKHNLFVIAIGAYDFQAVAQKQKKLLWTTKISTPSKGFDMRDVFASMLTISGPNIGRETTRPVLFNSGDSPKAEVKIGDARVVNDADTGRDAPKPASNGSAGRTDSAAATQKSGP